jgi:hypothetical protein
MASAARNQARWRRKGIIHTKWREEKRAKSQTPGRQKTEWCQADKTKRFMATKSRSYKHPRYQQWCEKMDSINRRKA